MGCFVESHVIHQSLRLAITYSVDSLGCNVHWCQSYWTTLSTIPVRSFCPFADFFYALLVGCMLTRGFPELGFAFCRSLEAMCPDPAPSWPVVGQGLCAFGCALFAERLHV
jgi:hypothetical protein